MSTVLDGLYYSESHEWLKVEGEFGYIGITDYAQHQLGSVVYVDLPEVDDELNQGEEFGAVESVKAASDLLSPISGTVVEINEALEDKPELLNEDAFNNWICKVTISDPEELKTKPDGRRGLQSYLRIIDGRRISTCTNISRIPNRILPKCWSG